MWPLKRLPGAGIAVTSLNGNANLWARLGVKCAKVLGRFKLLMELGVFTVVDNGLFP